MSDYNITKQILEDSHEILLTAEVASERVEKELRAQAKKLGKGVRIPGFRPGKAPVSIIIARLGRDYIMQEVADKLADEAFHEAIETVANEVAPGSAMRDVRLDPLTYEFIAPMLPEVDAGDYRSIRIPVEEVDEAKIQESVEDELKDLQSQNAVWEPVADRPVQYGDLVTLAIKLTVGEEEILNEEEWDFTPSETDYTLSPEFDANIVGMNVGDAKSFTLLFPEDSDSEYSGQEGAFDVEVKAIKAEALPELTDELVAENTDYETVAAFKEAKENEIRKQLQATVENDFQEKLLKALKEGATIHYAPATLHGEVERLEAEREDLYKSYGFENTEELLKLQGKTHEQYHKELEPQARDRLENDMLLDEIIRQEQLDASDYELAQYIRSANLSPEQKDELVTRLKEDEYYNLYIRMLVLREKAHKFLTAIAKGEEAPEPGLHPVEQAPEDADETDEESAAAAGAENAEEDASEEVAEAEGAELEAESAAVDETESSDDASN